MSVRLAAPKMKSSFKPKGKLPPSALERFRTPSAFGKTCAAHSRRGSISHPLPGAFYFLRALQ
jgi:hypothetical protein